MSGFILMAALLTAAALLCVLPALLRRGAGEPGLQGDQVNLAVLRDQAREIEVDIERGVMDDSARAGARDDLARRVGLDRAGQADARHGPRHGPPERLVALLLALALPGAAGTMYFQVGTPAALVLSAPSQPGGDGAHTTGTREIAAMVQSLGERLRREPDDIDGWHMLARSYSALGRYEDAANAYARLTKLLPEDAGLWADYADARATANGATLQGEPARLIARALALDPKQVKALALSGSAAYEAGQFDLAVTQWEKVLREVPAQSEFAVSTLASIAEARARANGAQPGPASGAQPASARQAAVLEGTVNITPALRATLKPDDNVFIFARALAGPPAPLAVARCRVRDLPYRFSLSDANAMMGGQVLSAQRQVVVGARVSRSGSATPAAGDPEGLLGPVAVGTRDLAIGIDSVRP